MPHYELPPTKAQEEIQVETASDGVSPDEWDRRITIPINAEILQSLSVGDDAEIVLVGRVEELTENQSSSGNGRVAVTLLISSVDTGAGQDEVEGQAFESGFDRGRGYNPAQGY